MVVIGTSNWSCWMTASGRTARCLLMSCVSRCTRNITVRGYRAEYIFSFTIHLLSMGYVLFTSVTLKWLIYFGVVSLAPVQFACKNNDNIRKTDDIMSLERYQDKFDYNEHWSYIRISLFGARKLKPYCTINKEMDPIFYSGNNYLCQTIVFHSGPLLLRTID